MFDTTQNHYHTRHVSSNVTVTEKRAPTDESVRLLREMENKARDEVIKAVSVADNNFNCVIHTMKETLSCQQLFKVIYTLNGKKYTTDYSVNEWDLDNREKWVKGLIEAVAYDIAYHLLLEPISKVLWEI